MNGSASALALGFREPSTSLLMSKKEVARVEE